MTEPNQNFPYRGPAPLEPASIGTSSGQFPAMRQLQPSFAPALQQQQPGAPPTAVPQPPVAAPPVPSKSTAPQAVNNTTRRTRITRACDTCRRKKIKCDVNSTFPCTTCQQYDWDCTFNDTAKKRGPPKGYIESLETRLKKMEKLLEQMQTGKGSQQQQQLQQQQQPEHSQGQKRKRSINGDEVVESPSGSEDRPSTAGDYLDPEKQVMRYHGSSSGYYLMGNMFKEGQAGSSSSAGNNDDQRYRIALNRGKTIYQIRKMNQDDNDLILVRDATDMENQMSAKDASKEELVPPQVMRALIDCYFEIPNVTLPVINKEQFLDAYEGRTSPPPPPLLVYAIGTNACFLISSDNPVFKEAGVSRDYVYHKLVERASELVRREYLIPRISSIQALVILCSQPTYSTSSYRNWILAGMAVRMAQDLGLHRSITTDSGSKELSEAKKRLWYSVYVTDRWCCAVMGRPLAIADSDCDIDLPEVQGSCDYEDHTIFVNFIKLSGILGEVLRRVYSPKAKASGYKASVMEPTVSSLRKMLEDWFAQLPDDCRMSAQDLEVIRREPERFAGSKKVTQGGPLTVCYHTVTLLLHRPFIVAEDEKTELYSAAIEKCLSAAKMAVDIARVVPTTNIARFGWNFSVYSVFQATLIHVYNCTSTDSVVAKMSHEYVKICTKEILANLSRDIPYGPPVIPFVEKLMSLLGAENNPENAPSANNASDAANTTSSTNNVVPPPPPPPPPTASQSPMSLQKMLAGVEGDTSAATAASSSSVENWSYNNNATATTSTTGGYPTQQQQVSSPSQQQQQQQSQFPPLSQQTWQQLFSSAGTPFTDDSTGFDLQGPWTNYLFSNQGGESDPNFYM